MKLLLILSACLCSGCGTIVTLSHNQEWPNQIYAGTRASANGHVTQIDVPFSLIADTLVLPYTIPRTIYNLSQQDGTQQKNSPMLKNKSGTNNLFEPTP